jgi:CRP/FNR family cyclic AMP-dependent transcriptional regulator
VKTLEDVLARHPFWNNLPPQYFPLLIECAVIEHFRPGEQISKKGYDAEHFYLIHQGKVALEMPYVPGEGLITIQTLGAGEALGWSWLFPPYQWHFGARAVEPTEAVIFKADALRNKAKENPAFGYDLALRVGWQLVNPQLRISEIAFEVGFQSLSQFNRAFRRHAGTSPRDYRHALPGAVNPPKTGKMRSLSSMVRRAASHPLASCQSSDGHMPIRTTTTTPIGKLKMKAKAKYLAWVQKTSA